MADLITLDNFHAKERHYHIYRTRGSTVAHHTHYHDYYQVCFVTRGRIQHCQAGTEVALGPGDCFIIPPGFSHSIHFLDPASEIYSLSFGELLFHKGDTRSGARRFLHSLRGEPVRLRVMLEPQRRDMLQSLMECLLTQQHLESPPEISAAASLIMSILYVLAQSYFSQPQNAPALNELTDSRDALRRCMEYLDTHYAEPLTLDALARRFGVSRSAFCAVFPQIAGMPFRKYMTHKRIQEAQILIRTRPQWSLSRIAEAVGYRDDSTFYRNFRTVAGVSPTQYRQLYSANFEKTLPKTP